MSYNTVMSDRRINVLYLVTELDVGGAERNLYQLVGRLPSERYRPVVAALAGGGEVGTWLGDAGVPVFDLGIRSIGDLLRGLLRLVKLLKGENVTILHSFLFHANVLGRFAGRLAGVRVVVSSVRVAERGRPWHVWLDGLTHCLVDAETVVAEGVRRFTHTRGGVPLRKLVTIHNGVDVARFQIERSEAREALHLDRTMPVVGFVGRFAKQKGVDLIPRIAREVCRKVKDVRFVLVGDGPLREGVEAGIGRLGLSESVMVLGRRDDVPTILAASDIMMLPSRWEGLANVILEAQAAGAVTVATDVEGSREAILPGVTGVIVPPGRPRAMADAIVGLIKDGDERKRLARAAKARVGRELSAERMAELNVELYERLVGPKRRRGRAAGMP